MLLGSPEGSISTIRWSPPVGRSCLNCGGCLLFNQCNSPLCFSPIFCLGIINDFTFWLSYSFLLALLFCLQKKKRKRKCDSYDQIIAVTVEATGMNSGNLVPSANHRGSAVGKALELESGYLLSNPRLFIHCVVPLASHLSPFGLTGLI